VIGDEPASAASTVESERVSPSEGLTPAAANRVAWNGGTAPFYEAWYAIFVDRETGDGYWIRQTLLNPLADHPQAGGTAWFAHTCRRDPGRSFAIARRFATAQSQIEPGRDETVLGTPGTADWSRWGPDAIAGAIAVDGHAATWDLRFDDGPTGETDVHFLMPSALRRASDRRATLTIPRPRTAIAGRVVIDGRDVVVAGAPGHQAHHYGRERADAWDWAHCAHFEDDPAAVLEALAPQLASGRLKPTFVHLHTRDRVYRCERAADLVRNRSSAGLGWWRFVGHDGGSRVEAEIVVEPARVLPFTYHSTAYAPSRCWNTQTGDCLVRVVERGKTVLALRSRALAAAEMHRSDLAQLPYESWSDPTEGLSPLTPSGKAGRGATP